MEIEIIMNLILVGESGVGKTSIVQRYVHNKFTKNFRPTIPVEYSYIKMKLEDYPIKLRIYDSAGQERYKSTVPQYFREAHGCILVYDVTNFSTFQNLSSWLSEFRKRNEKAPVLIAGNKKDDFDRKTVSVSQVKSYASQESMEFIECSAMTGENIQKVFENLIKKMWIPLKEDVIKVTELTPKNKKQGCCK